MGLPERVGAQPVQPRARPHKAQTRRASIVHSAQVLQVGLSRLEKNRLHL